MKNPYEKPLRVAFAMPTSASGETVPHLPRMESASLQFGRVTSLEPLTLPQGHNAWDILLAGLDFPGLQWKLQNRGIRCPVVILADPEREAEALELLEAGLISDYVITTRLQMKRLTTVLRAAHARSRIRGDWRPDGSRGVLQEAVYQIAEASEKASSLDELLPRIHEIIGRVMPAGNFYIALHESGQDTISFPYFVDEKDVLESKTFKLRNGLTEYVLRSGKSFLCAKDSQERLAISGDVDSIGTPSEIWLGVPLILDGTTIGVMVVQHYSDHEAYGESEQRMLEFVSSQVAMVIRRKQDQDALRLSEERFRGVFENTNVGLGRATLDGRLLLANAALVKMMGFSRFEDLQKTNLREDSAGASARRKFLDLLEREGQVRGFESVWNRADGSAIYARQDARLIRDPEGQPLYFEWVVEDITERRRAEILLREKVTALQSLAEIDREVLAAEQPQAILELVCDRIARLVHVPKAAVVTSEHAKQNISLASYGFEHPELLQKNLDAALAAGKLDEWSQFAVSGRDCGETPALEFITREGIRAMAGEPFSTSSGLQGSLLVFDTRPRTWTEDELQMVRLLAGQAALALEKIRLLLSARRRANEFASLSQVAGELMGRRDLDALLAFIVEKASGFHENSQAFIYLFDEKTRELSLTVTSRDGQTSPTVLKVGEGMAGRVAQSLEPMMVKDYETWEGRARINVPYRFHAVIEVPMLFDANLIGILGIEGLDPELEFGVDDLRLLSLMAEHAASAIYNARLFSQIEDRNRELARLSRVSTMLLAGASSDAASLCRAIADLLVTEFSYPNCSIWLLGEDGQTMERAAVAGTFGEQFDSNPLNMRGPGLISRALRTKSTLNIGDVGLSTDYVCGWEPTRSELSVPMYSADQMVGVIDLQSAELEAYGADDVRLIELIASRTALMLDHVRLYQQTEHRLQQLTVLSNIDAAIASSLDLQVTLNILVSQISMYLRADAVDVLLFNPHIQMLEFAIGRGFRGSAIRRVSLLLGEDQAGRAALDRTVLSVADLASPHLTLFHPERIAGEDFKSMFAVPLIAKGQLKGVLELFFREPKESDPDWLNFLETLARQAAVAVEDARLFNDLQRSVTDLAVAYDASVEGWGRISRMRQKEPEYVSKALDTLTLRLCRQMGLPEDSLAHIHRGVLLHDIGKLSIPDIIILKNGPLTDEEWQVMRSHPVNSFDLLQPIAFLRPALSIPYCQHERWDGSGYPRGLKAREIPLEARIFSVVNAWTMLQCDRPFRSAWTREQATAYLQQKAGIEFDPEVVKAFLQLLPELEDLQMEIMAAVGLDAAANDPVN